MEPESEALMVVILSLWTWYWQGLEEVFERAMDFKGSDGKRNVSAY